jgi:GT2 family glycosyltransferase
MYPKVSIIILNWNGWKDTVECLESVYRIDYPIYDVIVLDNGSGDDSIDKIRAYLNGDLVIYSKFLSYSALNKPIELLELSIEDAESAMPEEGFDAELPPYRRLILIESDRNYGFAEGCNIGMKYALNALDPEYILLLNNDTVLDRRVLTEMIQVAEADRSVGFAGPMVYYYDMDGRSDIISVAGIELDMNKGTYNRLGSLEADVGQYHDVKTVDYLEGSCILVKREVLKKVGLLDPRYFAYWEETDLCVRGFEAGYRSVFVPSSKIWHKISSSAESSVKLYYMTRNRLWFMRDHATKEQLFHFLIFFFAYQFWKTLAWFGMQKDVKKIRSFLKGVADGII